MNPEQQNYLWEKIRKIKVGMMTSRDGEVLRSRPMYLTQKTFDGTLWFFTHAESHKAMEVGAQSDVNISFMDIDADEYVSVSGSASLSQEQSVVDELWNPMVAAWFPEGKESKSVMLLKIQVKSAEVWDSQEGKMKQMFDMLKANMTRDTPDMGNNVKLS